MQYFRRPEPRGGTQEPCGTDGCLVPVGRDAAAPWEAAFAQCGGRAVMARLSEAWFEAGADPCAAAWMVRRLVRTAQESGVLELSVLIPPLPDAECAGQVAARLREAASGAAAACRIGLELATPDAVLHADRYAPFFDFAVFQTDELTRRLYCLGRSVGEAVDCYAQGGLLEQSILCTFDEVGLGALLLMGVHRARCEAPGLRLGVDGGAVREPCGRSFCEENRIDFMLLADASANHHVRCIPRGSEQGCGIGFACACV